MQEQVQEYFSLLSDERSDILLKLRETVYKVFPKIVENFDYQMPTYVLNEQTLCAFGSKKNYVSFYIMPYDLMENFKPQLSIYNCGKSCIRFKELTNGDLAFFRHLLKFCGDNYLNSKYYGKMNRTA